MFRKILIANRGEIACRVIRTCRRLAIETVAVHSDVDAHALHVEEADEAALIGGARPADSYLRGDKLIAAAIATGAEAIHPGYGFLSENEEFARAVEAAGLAFIGPTPEAIGKMGLKDRAKALMEAAGVPVVPGYHGESQETPYLREQAQKIGYPVLVKAVAGGGGKGMRLVERDADFIAQLAAAQREAKNAFGDDRVLIERFVAGPHHIEFQVFGDSHGNCVHLFERECSIQRRHQKILEETPSPFLDDELRSRMGEAAVAAARAIAYRGAGTVEFIVGADRQFFFMEMNTRLQVEHPVTEMITGEDLVEWQLRVAAGEELPLTQREIVHGGHAIEVRLCAEDPANQFLPETGTIERFAQPEPRDDVRLDTGVREGDAVGVYYDPMIAKLAVWGSDRAEAVRRLQDALAATAIVGVTTNLGFLQSVARHPAFLAGETDTGFIAAHREALFAVDRRDEDLLLVGAALRVVRDDAARLRGASPWDDTTGWRLNQPAIRQVELRSAGGEESKVRIVTRAAGLHVILPGGAHDVQIGPSEGDRLALAIDGTTRHVRVVRHRECLCAVSDTTRADFTLVDPFHYESADTVDDGRLTALMPGRVAKLMVAAGAAVKKGQALLILEAMKMEHTIVSPRDGVIARIAFAENDLVPADAVLFAFEEPART
jgi:3-methylcrotonyl-CoA carboxylase alpha subunit